MKTHNLKLEILKFLWYKKVNLIDREIGEQVTK